METRIAKMAVQTKDELKAALHASLCRLQKMPDLVASFFRTPTCRYASA